MKVLLYVFFLYYCVGVVFSETLGEMTSGTMVECSPYRVVRYTSNPDTILRCFYIWPKT